MNNCLLCVYVCQQKGQTPLMLAVNKAKGNVVSYLINKCKEDITQFNHVRLFTRYSYSWLAMYICTSIYAKIVTSMQIVHIVKLCDKNI